MIVRAIYAAEKMLRQPSLIKRVGESLDEIHFLLTKSNKNENPSIPEFQNIKFDLCDDLLHSVVKIGESLL